MSETLVEPQVDVVAMWTVVRHSALSVALASRRQGGGDGVAHLVLARAGRHGSPVRYRSSSAPRSPSDSAYARARGRAQSRNSDRAMVSVAPSVATALSQIAAATGVNGP